ncbi:MAG: hypothetical protein HC914_16200 [Chloroflexaceae bacterium]|nr:hypothetical protein [Chloroflexaceae bacterium]
MAFVAKPTITISYSVRDNDGKQSSTEVQIDGATPPANAVGFADALRALIAPLTDGVIVGQNVIIGAYEDAIPVINRSDVEDKGVFIFNTANGLASSIAIPSVAEAVLQANNEDIDLTLAAVGAFVDAFTLGAGTPLVQPANASGGDIVSVKEAYKQNRRSLKGGGTRRKG